MAALGFSLEACAPKMARPALTPSRPMLRLPLVDVSWDRVIRTTIGLRPHRPSGFVLKADKLDGKTVIHPQVNIGLDFILIKQTSEAKFCGDTVSCFQTSSEDFC